MNSLDKSQTLEIQNRLSVDGNFASCQSMFISLHQPHFYYFVKSSRIDIFVTEFEENIKIELRVPGLYLVELTGSFELSLSLRSL